MHCNTRLSEPEKKIDVKIGLHSSENCKNPLNPYYKYIHYYSDRMSWLTCQFLAIKSCYVNPENCEKQRCTLL